MRALRAGIAPEAIVFSGVGKTDAEIDAALAVGIGRFNIESRAELDALQRLAAARGTVAVAAVRINPDVDARTHAKISTGKAENKFGVPMDEARAWFEGAADRPNVRLDGLHMHIGSQLLSLDPVREALRRMAAFWRALEAAGHGIASIDVGGGLGVRYRDGEVAPDASEYADAIREALVGFTGHILVEPGRWLVAEAGLLLTRVVLEKQGRERRFLMLDAGMNDLLRPSLYDAWHDIVRVGETAGRDRVAYDVVGPVCETGDTFARQREMPRCAAGDLVAILGAGAYGASMASTYNARPLATEVLVEDGRYAVIRRRQTFDAMIADERPADDWRTA
jgi:diaminopimelate decarboxylase